MKTLLTFSALFLLCSCTQEVVTFEKPVFDEYKAECNNYKNIVENEIRASKGNYKIVYTRCSNQDNDGRIQKEHSEMILCKDSLKPSLNTQTSILDVN